MRPCFDNLWTGPVVLRDRLDRALLQPVGELPRQQLTKQASHTDAGVKIAAAANNVLFLFVIPINRTIKRQFHEARESDASSLPDLLRNNFGNLIQLLASWCGFS